MNLHEDAHAFFFYLSDAGTVLKVIAVDGGNGLEEVTLEELQVFKVRLILQQF